MKSSTYYEVFFFLEPRFSSSYRKNLKISRSTLQSQISYLTDPNPSVHVKYQSNKWSLSNPTHESKTGISNDRLCSNTLNTPMACNTQLRCKLCPINNTQQQTKRKKFNIQTKTKQNKTDKVFVHSVRPQSRIRSIVSCVFHRNAFDRTLCDRSHVTTSESPRRK